MALAATQAIAAVGTAPMAAPKSSERGAIISAMVAASSSANDSRTRVAAAVASLVIVGVAAEKAAVKDGVRGPGTFVPAFLDELDALRQKASSGEVWWKDCRIDVEAT